MRRPTLSPPEESGKSQRERNRNPVGSWMLWGKAHLDGGAMRGSHPESVPWDGDVER